MSAANYRIFFKVSVQVQSRSGLRSLALLLFFWTVDNIYLMVLSFSRLDLLPPAVTSRFLTLWSWLWFGLFEDWEAQYSRTVCDSERPLVVDAPTFVWIFFLRTFQTRCIDEVRAAALDCAQWQRNSKECVVRQSWLINESSSGPLIPLSHHNPTFFSTHLHSLNVLMSAAALTASLMNSPLTTQIRGWVLRSDALQETINKPGGEAWRLSEPVDKRTSTLRDCSWCRCLLSSIQLDGNETLGKWTDSVWGKHTAINWPFASVTVLLCWQRKEVFGCQQWYHTEKLFYIFFLFYFFKGGLYSLKLSTLR